MDLQGIAPADFHALLNQRNMNLEGSELWQYYQILQGNPLALKILFEQYQSLTLPLNASRSLPIVKITKEAVGNLLRGEASQIAVVPTTHGLKTMLVSEGDPIIIAPPSGLTMANMPYFSVRSKAHSWREQLERFDQLINDPSTKESDFQQFFDENWFFLSGLDYHKVIPHPVLVRDCNDGPLIPDYLLKPLDRSFCDILDLKLPTAKLIAGSKDRLRWTSKVNEAISQLREYQAYFDDPARRKIVKDVYGVTCYKPSLSVVIGRTPSDISAEKYQRLLTTSNAVRLFSYDDLRARMEKLIDFAL
jgi:hypothetical protein